MRYLQFVVKTSSSMISLGKSLEEQGTFPSVSMNGRVKWGTE